MEEQKRFGPDPWPLGVLPVIDRPVPAAMRALAIERDRYGPPAESIRLATVPVPRLRGTDAGRVLVAVLATGPNFNTNFAALGLPVPVFGRGDSASLHIPGSDALGIVVDAGAAVTRLRVGQAVILDSWTGKNIRGYETHDGFHAQFVSIEEERAVPVPAPLRRHSPESLSAVLLAYGTAYRAVVERLRVRPGDSVLVMGGGKGTSFAAAQIAKRLGARVILVGSNRALAESLIARSIADAFVDRRQIPPTAFGPIRPDEAPEEFAARAEPFRAAVLAANGGNPVDRIFEHTGGDNFPLLVSALARGGALAFFGATGKGLKGEYRETFLCEGKRFVFDARWVWMRQKQILFRSGSPAGILAEIGLPPGRRGMVWGADPRARAFVEAALARGADVAVVASRTRETRGIEALAKMGVPPSRIVDRDAFAFADDMPDPLTEDGRMNPGYAAGFLKGAQALGKALWGVFGPRQSPDFVVDRMDQSTLHLSAFVARDFDERDAMPCGHVIFRCGTDLTIAGSHMYGAAQAAEVLRLLASGKIVMEQEDLDVTTLPGLPALQQKMLDGAMSKPKGVALVQADRPGRTIAECEDAFFGDIVRRADPGNGRFLEIRALGDVSVLTITRPDALNALSEDVLEQLAGVAREIGASGTAAGRPARALVLRGAGRAFVAGADVNEFLGRSAGEVAALASKNIAVFAELERLDIPVIAVVDGFALGGGNELAMSAHYRIVTENASLGQPEVKLGIIPGYGGMQRLPRLVGPARAAAMCINGEPVDGRTAVDIGLADEFVPSASALPRAVALAREILAGESPLLRRNWDGIAEGQKEELEAVLSAPEIRKLLAAPTPDAAGARDLAAARRAAGRDALLAMEFGYRSGFAAGLDNDARAFGSVAASAGGQEWIRRFLAKDPLQGSYLALVPGVPRPAPDGGPISKKAPGDRQLSDEEIGEIAARIREKIAEGKVSALRGPAVREIAALLRQRPPPRILEILDPAGAARMIGRLAALLERGKVSVGVVDLDGRAGFPRENARPVCEVLLVEKEDAFLRLGRRRLPAGKGGKARIFLPKEFVRRSQERPHLLLQAILHPLLEWVYGLPHMVAVLCESAYNASAPAAADGQDVSDLNRFIAQEAGRDRDFAYFDRILGAEYEPDEFRMEELRAHFGQDEAGIREVVGHARAAARGFRALMERILSATREEIARERVAAARAALEESDADQALVVLRGIGAPAAAADALREEIAALTELAIRSYALDADSGYEGLRLAAGRFHAEPWAGAKARDLCALLDRAADIVRETRAASPREEKAPADPLSEGGAARSIHVVIDLERPSAKFIDGHDRIHWVFEKSFVAPLLAGRAEGRYPRGIPALLACRIVRDGAFPDEKLKTEAQFAAAVKGAVEGYRFYESLPEETREEMAAFLEATGTSEPLHRLFVSLGGESHPSRAGRLIRQSVARTHSYNYVRYPDTPLAGQVVVVTGGGTGMGRALALEAALQGANVAVTGRRPRPLEETKADMDDIVRQVGMTNQTITVQGDVSDPKYVGEMFDRIEREFGRIDILFNNAGVPGPVEFGAAYREEHLESYREAVGIHLTGSYLASLEAARVMEAQPGGGTVVMVGTFYSESVHRHVLHAYPGRLPYTSAQSAKLALGDYLAWTLAGKGISVLSLNPSAVSTDRIRRGTGVFDKGSRARARIGRNVSPESLEKDTLDRTVGHEFVRPRDFARVALALNRAPFRRTVGGQRIPIGGVTYEQPPGVIPSPASLSRYPDLVGKIALVSVDRPLVGDAPLIEETVRALARSGAGIVLAGARPAEFERLAALVNSAGGEGMATVCLANLGSAAEAQELFDGLPRLDLLVHFTGSVDWKRPLASLPFEEWTAAVDRYGYVPRLLCWQAERRFDRDGVDGTIVLVGPDLSGVPSIRERNLVQVFQAMLRPAVATEGMERTLMRKAREDGTAPAPVSDVNIGLVLPGRVDGRNRAAAPDRTAASVLWLAQDGKPVSGAVLLPDDPNSRARLPAEPAEGPGSAAGKVVVVTGGVRNLGRRISLRFAAEKATVVAASRRPGGAGAPADAEAAAALEAADRLLAGMRGLGGRSLWIDADVSRPRRVRALIDETRNRFGRIDVFVNNAGAGGDFSRIGDVIGAHRQSFDDVMRANFVGPWAAIARLRGIMAAQPGGGAIVNVSTHYADHPYLFRTIYTVSKILLKALTLSLREALDFEGIRIVDVAPSLIAGPRMEWVMRNYAERFAGEIDSFAGLSPAARTTLRETFLRSFGGAPAGDARDRAADAFRIALRGLRLGGGGRAAIESWYARVGEWFRATVPGAPPTNEQVADAVLYAAKNAPFLEDRFLGVAALDPFASFPPRPSPVARLAREEPFLSLSIGIPRGGPAPRAAVDALLSRAGAKVVSIAEPADAKGIVEIARPLPGPGRTRRGRRIERLSRELDLGDPRVVRPWADNALAGDPPPCGAVLFVGTSAAEKPLPGYDDDEMERFVAHVAKALNVFSEAVRALRPGGNLVVVAPPHASGEAILLRAALRQIVRTFLAESHFLPSAKAVGVSLVPAPGAGDLPAFASRAAALLLGNAPPFVEPIPVGRTRP